MSFNDVLSAASAKELTHQTKLDPTLYLRGVITGVEDRTRHAVQPGRMMVDVCEDVTFPPQSNSQIRHAVSQQMKDEIANSSGGRGSNQTWKR